MSQAPDRDTLAVMALLSDAVAASGLSQAGFATALGTSAPRLSTYITGSTRPSAHFCMRAQRLAHALQMAASRGLMSAPGTAAAMRAYLADGEIEWVWRMLLQGRDHLRLLLARTDTAAGDAWEAAPGTTGDAGWDALLAALVEREFAAAGLEAPGWAAAEPLTQEWLPEHPFLSPERVRRQTPSWLAELNIFVPERDLVTA